MRTRFAAALIFLALARVAAAAPPPASPKPFVVIGIKATITVTRGDSTLPASLVPFLKGGDTIRIAFPKDVQFDSDPRWHLVVAEMYPASLDKKPTFLISDATLSAEKPGHVWSFGDDGAGVPVIFLAPENGSRYGHGIPQVRSAIVSDADRSLLAHSALFSSNAVAKASTLGALMRSLRTADAAAGTVGGARVEGAATTLFGTAPGSVACFSSGTGSAAEYACASAAVAADYHTPTNVAMATTLGSQIAVNAAPYGILIGALYELLAKRRVEANYQFVPGALRPPSAAPNVYAESRLLYDPSGAKPSSVLYFQIGSQGTRALSPEFGPVPKLPACVSKATLAVAVPFGGLPVYFRAHSMSIVAPNGAFEVPAAYDPVRGYSATLSAAQIDAIRDGATATIASGWGFDTYQSAPVQLVVPRPVLWSADAGNAGAVVSGATSAHLAFSDGGAGMGSCVASVLVRDGLGHRVPVTSVTRTRDGVSVTIDARGAQSAAGSAQVVLDGGVSAKAVAFDILPAMPTIAKATAYLPKGVLILNGTNLKYIDAVALNNAQVTFGNGEPLAGDDTTWEFTAMSPGVYRPAWEHQTTTITYTMEPPDTRTDSAEVNVEYAAAATPQPIATAAATPQQ